MRYRGLHWRNLACLEPDAFEIAEGFGAFVCMSNMGAELPLVIRERWPDSLIISRLYWPAGELPTVDEAVKTWMPYILDTFRVVDGYVPLNEPDKEYKVSPQDFVKWFLEFLDRIRKTFGVRFGFPMPEVAGELSWQWAVACSRAVQAADFISEHCYWEQEWQMDDWNWGSRYFRCHQQWPFKGIDITEWGCSADLEEAERIRQYRHYLDSLPEYVGSASVFWMAGGDGWPQLWVTKAISLGITHTPADLALRPGELIAEGDSEMNEADRNRLWADYMAFPAFERYRADHPELGDALETGERDYGGYRVKFFAGGVIGCKIGDWANIQIWKAKEELPSPL